MERVTDNAMQLIFDLCWKNKREARKNRSFIRLFWSY